MNPFPDPERTRELFSELRPSPKLEAQLRARFRKHHRMRRVRRWTLPPALVAAAVLLAFLLRPPAVQESSSEDFYALPGAPITGAMLESSQIVRVELTPAALAQLGLPVAAGPVEAELLMTQDGLVRGVRFVP
jgi:hypothetical protein